MGPPICTVFAACIFQFERQFSMAVAIKGLSPGASLPGLGSEMRPPVLCAIWGKLLKKCLCIYLAVPNVVVVCAAQDLLLIVVACRLLVLPWRSSFLTRGRTPAHCIGSKRSQPLDHQKSLEKLFNLCGISFPSVKADRGMLTSKSNSRLLAESVELICQKCLELCLACRNTQ